MMEEAPDTTAFHGLRSYFVRTSGGPLKQIEEVGSDGNGHFGFELVELVNAPPSVVRDSYLIEAENAWRFALRVRDPRIVDADVVASNFLVSTVEANPTVAGIDCVRLRFLRHSTEGRRPGIYEADVDPDTGFALAWREFDASGQVLSSVVYLSFEYGGDLSGLTLQGRAFDATPVSVHQALQPQLTFSAHIPSVYPEGFQLVAAEIMSVPQGFVDSLPPGQASYLVPGDWLRLFATDGLEVTIFTYSANTTPGGAVAGELRMSSDLGWNIGHGRIAGSSFVVASRASLAAVQRLVASAF